MEMCDQCDMKTKWKGSLKQHIESVHGDVRYSCDLCNYKAKWKVSLKAHLESLHGDVRYSCDHCDYFIANIISFNYRSSYF